jgi:hypothetical protein
VALFPLKPILQMLEDAGQTPFFRSITHTSIPEPGEIEELDPLEEVIFLGYPSGLYDFVNLIPIFRHHRRSPYPAGLRSLRAADDHGRPSPCRPRQTDARPGHCVQGILDPGYRQIFSGGFRPRHSLTEPHLHLARPPHRRAGPTERLPCPDENPTSCRAGCVTR